MKLLEGYNLPQRGRRLRGLGLLGGPQIITLADGTGVQPVMQVLTNADTPADGFLASAYDTANYASSVGTISTAVREVSINGGAWTTTLTQDLQVGDTISGRIVVTDSAANVRNFGAGSVTVPALAIPVNSAAPAITGTLNVGQTLTMSNGTWTPTAGAFERRWFSDGVEIEEANGATYLIAPGDDGTTITGQNRAAVVSDGETGEFSDWVDATGGGAVTYAAPVAAGGLSNATYDLGSGDQIVNAAADFTNAVGGTWSVTGTGASISAAGVVTITTDALRTASTVTVTYTNSGGSDSSSFDVTVQDVPSSVNPTGLAITFNDPGNGVPDTIAATWSYSGSDTLVFYGVTSTATTPPGADAAAQRANIIAGTGTGNLEEFVIDPAPVSDFDLSGLTSTSNSATRIHGFLAEKNNGGVSAIATVTVSGLDFTAPTRSSVATDSSDGTTVIVTYSENIYGTEDAADWTITGHTVSNVAISGTTVTLTITPAIANGDSDTLSYSGGDLADGDGNPVATFSGVAVTNNVPAASGPYTDDFTGTDGALLSARSGWTTAFDEAGDGSREYEIQSNQLRGFASNPASASTIAYDFDQALNNNQYCQVEYISSNGAQPAFLLYARRTGSTNDGNTYRAFINPGVGSNNVVLAKRSGGTQTTLGSAYTHTFTTGDVFRLEANGTTIRILIDTGSGFTSVISVTDSTHTSGKAGIGNRLATSGLNTEIILDNWEAGNL